MSTYNRINNISPRNTNQSIFWRRRAKYQPDDIVYVTGTTYNSSTRSTENSSNKKGKITNVNKPWDQEFGIYGVRFDDGTFGSDIHENSISRYDSVFSIGDNVIDIVSGDNATIIDSYVKDNKYHHIIKFDDGSIKEDIPSDNLKYQSKQNKVEAKIGDSITINVYDNTIPNLIKKIIGRIIGINDTSYKIMTDKFTQNMNKSDLDITDEYPNGFSSNIENGDVVYVTGIIDQIYPTNTTIFVNEKEGRIIDSTFNYVMFNDGTRAMNIKSDSIHLYKNGDKISAFLNPSNYSMPDLVPINSNPHINQTNRPQANHFTMFMGGVGFGPLPGFVTAGPFGPTIHPSPFI